MTFWEYREITEQDAQINETLKQAYKSGAGRNVFVVQSTVEDVTVKEDQAVGFTDIFDPATATELFVVSSDAGDTEKTGTALVINADGAIEEVAFELDSVDATTIVSLGTGFGVIAAKLDAACAGTITICDAGESEVYATIAIADLYTNGCWFHAPAQGASLAYWSIFTETTDPSRQVAGVAIDGVTTNEQAAASAVGTTELNHGLVPKLEGYSYCMAESTSEDELNTTQTMIWLV